MMIWVLLKYSASDVMEYIKGMSAISLAPKQRHSVAPPTMVQGHSGE
jgi:hypothetical protein